jgi:hypothetical protein
MGGTVPQSVCTLLEALERIVKAFLTEKECKRSKASATGGGSSKKQMVSFSDLIPKKACKESSTVPYARSMGACRTPITKWGLL